MLRDTIFSVWQGVNGRRAVYGRRASYASQSALLPPSSDPFRNAANARRSLSA